MPTNVPHEVIMHGRAEMRTLYIRTEYFKGLFETCCVLNVSPLLKEMIIHIIELPDRYEQDSAEERFILATIDQIKTMEAAPLYLPEPEDPRVKLICESLQKNAADQRTLTDWAVLSNVSSRTLSRLFNAETGMSFIQYRQQIRLFKGLKLLAKGCPVSVVAMETGFHSQSAFIQLFKRNFGKTPKAYFH